MTRIIGTAAACALVAACAPMSEEPLRANT